MKWQDASIVENVADELSDLKSIIDILSQIPKGAANRILTYCRSYVNRESCEAHPHVESKVSDIMDALKGSILKEDKES